MAGFARTHKTRLSLVVFEKEFFLDQAAVDDVGDRIPVAQRTMRMKAFSCELGGASFLHIFA